MLTMEDQWWLPISLPCDQILKYNLKSEHRKKLNFLNSKLLSLSLLKQTMSVSSLSVLTVTCEHTWDSTYI
jgi:hypothetical protein